MPSIQQERWSDCWQELDVLWNEYRIESGLPIRPDHERYRILDEKGALLLAVMRDQHDAMTGVHRSVLGPNLHQVGMTLAISDGWFVTRAARRGLDALQLLRFAEQLGRKAGASYLYQGSDSGRDIGKLLQHAGWERSSCMYRKEL